MKLSTLGFTATERRRIEKAGRICGWETGEIASFARVLLLRTVGEILRGKPRKARNQIR
jgi:hypothetical protein